MASNEALASATIHSTAAQQTAALAPIRHVPLCISLLLKSFSRPSLCLAVFLQTLLLRNCLLLCKASHERAPCKWSGAVYQRSYTRALELLRRAQADDVQGIGHGSDRAGELHARRHHARCQRPCQPIPAPATPPPLPLPWSRCLQHPQQVQFCPSPATSLAPILLSATSSGRHAPCTEKGHKLEDPWPRLCRAMESLGLL